METNNGLEINNALKTELDKVIKIAVDCLTETDKLDWFLESLAKNPSNANGKPVCLVYHWGDSIRSKKLNLNNDNLILLSGERQAYNGHVVCSIHPISGGNENVEFPLRIKDRNGKDSCVLYCLDAFKAELANIINKPYAIDIVKSLIK